MRDDASIVPYRARAPRRRNFAFGVKAVCRAGVHARRTDEFCKKYRRSRFLDFAKVRRAKSPALRGKAKALPNGRARKNHM